MHLARADSKLHLAEYKSKLKQIIESHPSESIHFRQFIKLLSSHHILMHSKSQILKISRFFDNPLKLCRIQVPLAYLELDSVKICAAKRYFIAKVRTFTVYSGLLEGSREKLHEVEECLAELMKRLRKNFGNQTNWFRELGGNSIAMTIDADIFRSKIVKILQNSPHIVCIKRLVLRFQKQGNKKEVEWKNFTNIIKNCQQNNQLHSKDKKNNTFMTSFSLFSPTSAKSIEKSSSLDVQRRHAESSLSSSTYRRKWLSKTLTNAENEKEKEKGEFFRSFCLSSKKCVIYDKRSQQFSSTMSSSLRATKTSRLTYRHIKTEKSFEQQQKQSNRQRKKERVKLHTQENEDQLNRSQKQRNNEKIKQKQQIKSKKQEQKKVIDNKVEEYVVLLENQSGVHIQI